MSVSFDLAHEGKRQSFQIVFGMTVLVNIGPKDARVGFMRVSLAEALDGIAKGFAGSTPSQAYVGWAFDPASLVVEQIPSNGKKSDVIALLGPLLTEAFPAT